MNQPKAIDAKTVAFQMAIAALIESHPNKGEFLNAFDRQVGAMQTDLIATGRASSTPPELRMAVDYIRDLALQGGRRAPR